MTESPSAHAEPVKDPLALGLGSLGAGLCFGAAFLTVVQIAAKILRGELEAGVYRQTSGDPLLIGVFVAAGIGAAVAVYRSRPLENIWQRGVIAVLAAIGACLDGFLAALFDRFLGFIGLTIWLLLNLVLGLLATRWAIQGKGVEAA